MLKHEIPAVFDGGSKVLLLGSFPSPKSREQGFFYGHPQNRMWRVLAKIFDSDVPATVDERRAFLLERKIAMWDVLASCDIDGASDSSIRNERPNDLRAILDAAPVKAIFTTGGKAAQFYRKYDAQKYSQPHVPLPSTSSANAAMSFDALVAAYRQIRAFIDGQK